jgi:hypothetical protein
MLKRLQQWNMARTIKKHRDNQSLIMGVTCYRPEQWHLLQEVSEDTENFDKTYEPGLFMKPKPVHGIHSIMSYNRTPNQLKLQE